MNDEYYILEDENKTGPFSFREVTERDIDIHTRILAPRANEWQYASELPEFNEYFEAKGIYFPTVDNLAGFGRRTLAFFIDYFAIYFLVEIIETQMGWVVLPTKYTIGAPVPTSMYILYLSFFVTFLLYNTIFEASNLKASIGKIICRLNVVDINGSRLTPVKALGRTFGILLSVTIWLPFLSIFFSEHRQAWYDNLAKAYIIVKPVKL